MSQVVWRVNGTELRFKWSRGAAFQLSKQGFDGPDSDRFEAFLATLAWACCSNKGKATPEQFVSLIFAEAEDPTSDEGRARESEFQDTCIELLKASPWKAIGIALEDHKNNVEEEGVRIGQEDEPGKPESESIAEPSSENGPLSEQDAE